MFFRKLFDRKESESASSGCVSSLTSCNIIFVGSYSPTASLLKVVCGCKILADRGFIMKEFELSSNNTIKLNIWNIAGNEGFSKMLHQYCRDSHGAILCYDPTDNTTFTYIKSVVENNIKELSKLRIPIHLVGVSEKKSKKKDNEDYQQDEVQKLFDKIGTKVTYCSLDDVKGINEMFKNFVNNVIKNSKNKPNDKKK